MTNDDIVNNLKQVLALQAQVETLRVQRHQDEVAICTKYQVDACNAEINASVQAYQDQIDVILGNIVILQNGINAALTSGA